jgi:hypothetical protein
MENQQTQNPQEQENPQNNKSLFVVSSAIYSNHGVYDTKERLLQTIETCKSIHSRVDSCDIILLDGGTSDLSDEEKDELNPYINEFYSYADTENVKELQKSKNWDIVKNMIEIMIFGEYFEENKQSIQKDYNRVFKVSGRYNLTNDFDYQYHLSAKNQIVIRGLYTSQFPPQVTGNVTLQYMSRLWSFDSSIINYISAVYKNMFDHMNDRLKSGGYIDIEHLLYHHLDCRHTKVVSKIGIEGNIAPNGQRIND